MAAGSHFTKSGARVLINTSPEPFSNWTASIAEDIAVFAGLWAALYHPTVFLALLIVFIAVMIWLWPKLWRALRKLFSFIGRLLGKRPAAPDITSAINLDNIDLKQDPKLDTHPNKN